MATTRPKRRSLTISLRLFLVLVLVAGTWMAWKANRTRAQRRAIEAVERAGGVVGFDYEFRGGEYIQDAKPWEAAWLRRMLGDDFFHDVVYVGYSDADSRVNSAMSSVEQFDRLEELDYFNSKLEDAGLSHVRNLKGLKVLILNGTRVTNRGLMHLRSLENLEELRLCTTDTHGNHVALDEEGVENILGLTKLKKLSMFNSGANDRTIRHISRLRSLEELDLALSNISDDGLEHLVGLTRLRKLELGCSHFTDRGMATLAKMTSLRELDLGGDRSPDDPDWHSPITAVGVKHLTKLRDLEFLTPPDDVPVDDLLALPKLKAVNLSYHALIREEIGRLRSSYPTLTIETNPFAWHRRPAQSGGPTVSAGQSTPNRP
jgi:Leucine-rich repeat (LRR) protein